MKYFVAVVLIAAVASAGVIKPIQVSGELAEVQQIIAAINSPSTNPATAALLEQMLYETLGISNPTPVTVVDEFAPISVGPVIADQVSPIAVGPAFVDTFEPIAVGPAFVDTFEPIAVGPAFVDAETTPVGPADSAVVDAAAVDSAASPLVQIIINIQSGASVAEKPVSVITPETVEEAINPTPVIVEESAPIVPSPVVLPEAVLPEVVLPVVVMPEPVQVAEPIIPEPVQVAEPVIPEPIIVGTPILPAPAVVLPETLN